MKTKIIFLSILTVYFNYYSFSGNNKKEKEAPAATSSNSSNIINSQISINPFGNYILVSKGTKETKNQNSFNAQKYYHDGAVNGKPLQLTPSEKGEIKNLAVAMNVPGEYFVTWQTVSKTKSGIYGVFVESNSTVRGKELLLQSSNLTAQILSSDVAMDNFGNAVVCWVSETLGQKNVFIQQIKNYGVRVSNAVQINPAAIEGECYSKIAVNHATDDFAIAWSIYNADKTTNEVFVERFDKNANKLGEAISVDQVNTNKAGHFDLTLNNKGNLMVIWECENIQEDNTPKTCLNGKIYDWTGNVVTDKFTVNQDFDNKVTPTIRCNILGNFVVASQVANNENKDEVVFTLDAGK